MAVLQTPRHALRRAAFFPKFCYADVTKDYNEKLFSLQAGKTLKMRFFTFFAFCRIFGIFPLCRLAFQAFFARFCIFHGFFPVFPCIFSLFRAFLVFFPFGWDFCRFFLIFPHFLPCFLLFLHFLRILPGFPLYILTFSGFFLQKTDFAVFRALFSCKNQRTKAPFCLVSSIFFYDFKKKRLKRGALQKTQNRRYKNE